MSIDLLYLILGTALLLAAVLPSLLERYAISAAMVLLAVGLLVGLLPLPRGLQLDPAEVRPQIERFSELTVLVALMGVGLAIDRPLDLRRPATWRAWSPTWRLLAIAMPLTIVGVAVLGWWVGVAPAAALLLGSALAPTDPVLASDVQVEGPRVAGTAGPDGDTQSGDEVDDTSRDTAGDRAENGAEESADDVDDDIGDIDEEDEVRFALTSEAGLNDGLAFPFVTASVLLATVGTAAGWVPRWLAWDVVGKVVIGVVAGAALGWALGRVAFRASRRSLRLAEQGEPLLAIAALVMTYGFCQVLGGYGFLGVFACGLTLRAGERGHHYHRSMHEVVQRLERLLTLLVLLLLGMAVTNGLLAELDWRGVVVGVALVFLIRPVAGLVCLRILPRPAAVPGGLTGREALATAFFGVRGVGSLYYLAHAAGLHAFAEEQWLWSTVAFTIMLSVFVHGVLATPVMGYLERRRSRL